MHITRARQRVLEMEDLSIEKDIPKHKKNEVLEEKKHTDVIVKGKHDACRIQPCMERGDYMVVKTCP